MIKSVAINVALATMVLGRLLAPGLPEKTMEMTIILALVGWAIWRWVERPAAKVAAYVGLAAVAAFAYGHTDVWFVLQTHLHNLVPVFFLFVQQLFSRQREPQQQELPLA